MLIYGAGAKCGNFEMIKARVCFVPSRSVESLPNRDNRAALSTPSRPEH